MCETSPITARLDDDRVGGRAHDALGAAAALPLLDELDQPALLQRAHVVVDALPGLAEPAATSVAEAGCCRSSRTAWRNGAKGALTTFTTNRKSDLSNTASLWTNGPVFRSSSRGYVEPMRRLISAAVTLTLLAAAPASAHHDDAALEAYEIATLGPAHAAEHAADSSARRPRPRPR